MTLIDAANRSSAVRPPLSEATGLAYALVFAAVIWAAIGAGAWCAFA